MATKKIPWVIWKDSDGRGWLEDIGIGLAPGVERPGAEILEEALDPLTSEKRILDLFSQRWIYVKSEIPRGFERFLRSEGDGYNFTSAQKSLLSLDCVVLQEVVVTNASFPSPKAESILDGRTYLRWFNENPNAIFDYESIEAWPHENRIKAGIVDFCVVDLRRILLSPQNEPAARSIFENLDPETFEGRSPLPYANIGSGKFFESAFTAHYMSLIFSCIFSQASKESNSGWAAGFAMCIRTLHDIQDATGTPRTPSPLANVI